jgi:hypothetical protein
VTTKDNVIILFELVLVKSNHIYAEIKYKSESNMKEPDFEKFLSLILCESFEGNKQNEDCCR